MSITKGGVILIYYKLLRESVHKTREYVPGKSIEEIAKKYNIDPENIIKLGSNENALGASPKAIKAIIENAKEIYRYPSADATELRDAISEYVKYPRDNIVVGVGMDGVLDTLMRLFVGIGEEAIIPTPTFSYYEFTVNVHGGTPIFIRRDENFNIDVDKLLNRVNKKTKFIFLCSPNNPSGNTMMEEDIRKIVESVNAIVLVDEAYVEFANKSIVHLVKEYENLVVTRTMSKLFGLAGFRVGYGILPDWMVSEYLRVTTPFSVNRLAVVAGVAALKDKEFIKKSIENAKIGREILKKIPFKVFQSEANFVLVDVSPYTAKEVTESLLQKGIIVRDCTSFRDAGDSLIRITIGTPEQNERVIEGLFRFKV